MSKKNIIKTQEIKKTAPPATSQGSFLNLTQAEKISYGMLVATILLVILIRSKFTGIPFERDEGAYGYYGKLCLEGKIPYKDFYEQKFPGIFYFFAFMVGVFGDTVVGLHTGFIVLNIVTLTLLFFAAKRLFSPYAGVITAITFAIVSLTPNLSGFTVQSEHGVAFFISLGIFIYTFTLKSNHWKNYFLMGIALGCAFMTKTSGMFLTLWGGIVIVLDAMLTAKKFDLKEVLRRGAIYTAGVFLVIGILFLIIYLKGSFNEMIFWTYENPKRYVNKMPWEEGKKYLSYSWDAITGDYKLFWMHAFLGLAIIFFKSVSWRIKLMGITLLGLSFATIFPGFYFYGHYWIQILPGLAIMAGLTFFAFSELFKNKPSTRLTAQKIYVAVFVIASLVHLNKLKSYYFNPNYERILRAVYGNNPFPESMEIAKFITANSKPEDGIVLIGSEPQIYFYTQKKCPSRHAYFASLVDDTPEHKGWQREFTTDVEKAKPKFLVFFKHSISLFVQPNTDGYIFEWANKYVTENYQLAGLVDMPDGMQSSYVWREAMNTYKPTGQNIIFIYERKANS